MASCTDEPITKSIAIKNQKVAFNIASTAPAKGNFSVNFDEGEEVLFEGEINVAKVLDSIGFPLSSLNSFAITGGTLEEEIPSGYDMHGLVGMKLYFDNTDNLVARADVVEEGTVLRFTIVNGELLNKLENEKLYIILVGTRPNVDLSVELVMDFLANFTLVD